MSTFYGVSGVLHCITMLICGFSFNLVQILLGILSYINNLLQCVAGVSAKYMSTLCHIHRYVLVQSHCGYYSVSCGIGIPCSPDTGKFIIVI